MQTPAEGNGERPGGAAGAPGRQGRRVVLLVEDEDADRDVYGGLLWYNGYDVVHAPDGDSAITRALEWRPDLVLLDMMLPGEFNGLDVARWLRSEAITAPIVMLSAVPREELGAALEQAGVSGYLEKPIDPFLVVKEVMRRLGPARPGDDEPEPAPPP